MQFPSTAPNIMLNHPNIVDFLFYDETIIIKFKNPKFFLFPRKHAPTAHVPLPISAEKSPNKHINKTVFVAPFTSRYFHLLLEYFPLILELKNKVNLTDTVITAPMPLDEETGLFKHFTNKYEYPYYDFSNIVNSKIFNFGCLEGFKHNFSIIPDFCKYFGINLICMPEHEFIETSFDYAYFIYGQASPFDERYIFMDRELFIGHSNFKANIIDKINSLVPTELNEECEDQRYQMLLPHKTRKNVSINSFKILRDNYPKFNIVPGKKIYVSRKKTPHRNIQEEKYIEEYFQNLDYDIVYFEELNFLEQSQVCQESEKIVCLYGSSLLNCGFCSDKTTVISIKYNMPANDCTINSLYNDIFKKYSIQHIELEYNGNDLLDFIKTKKDLW